ncbi:hypothetical protein BT67DRAFT_75700 [Trichocladium antarcticum]|uniref:Uncharacterized protein n=1 Tax=Trichocladium antarcticum TaxID=1450529 RepID=A0AAN6UHE2_9PEZI|nr:hypothetical protein BT67DRAFT_75700 [Trichocladium antarcticum]
MHHTHLGKHLINPSQLLLLARHLLRIHAGPLPKHILPFLTAPALHRHNLLLHLHLLPIPTPTPTPPPLPATTLTPRSSRGVRQLERRETLADRAHILLEHVEAPVHVANPLGVHGRVEDVVEGGGDLGGQGGGRAGFLQRGGLEEETVDQGVVDPCAVEEEVWKERKRGGWLAFCLVWVILDGIVG